MPMSSPRLDNNSSSSPMLPADSSISGTGPSPPSIGQQEAVVTAATGAAAAAVAPSAASAAIHSLPENGAVVHAADPPAPSAAPTPRSNQSSTLSSIYSSVATRISGSRQVASQFIKNRFGAPLTIVIAGETGLGKSTLVNQVFGFDIAKAGAGKPVTTKARLYADDHVRIVDTVGFIRGIDSKAQAFDGDLLLKLVDPNPTSGQHIIDVDGKDVKDPLKFDMVWYFIDRFQPEDERVLQSLLDMKVPTLVIIAKCDAKKHEDVAQIRSQVVDSLTEHSDEMTFEIAEMRNPQNGPSSCEECESRTIVKPRQDGRPGHAWYCTNENCEFYTTHLTIADTRSLRKSLTDLNLSVEVLLSRTLHSDSADRYRRAQLIDTDSKTRLAAIPISIATLGSLAIGLTPIPFADAPLLMTAQAVMIISICSIYGISISEDSILGFIGVALAGAAAPALGLLAVNLLRLVPGAGTIAAAAIEAPVAASLTLSLGIVVLMICRRLLQARLEGGGTAMDGRPNFTYNSTEVRRDFANVAGAVRDRVGQLFQKTGSADKKAWSDGIEAIVLVRLLLFSGAILWRSDTACRTLLTASPTAWLLRLLLHCPLTA
ncbi:hypothetical protein DFJ73DRAFT_387234 [Zopfochytrium polystomum]|nr:hypothetical protein DFJ73DRAFT_387234 [Zopfochytrium polystomum]